MTMGDINFHITVRSAEEAELVTGAGDAFRDQLRAVAEEVASRRIA